MNILIVHDHERFLIIKGECVWGPYRIGAWTNPKHIEGNPYLVWSEPILQILKLDPFDTNITVAKCRSGDLEYF